MGVTVLVWNIALVKSGDGSELYLTPLELLQVG